MQATTHRGVRRWTSLAAVLALAGCASLPPDAGFSGVQRALSERAGPEPVWPRDDSAREANRQAIAALLAAPLDENSAVRLALLNNPEPRAAFEALGIRQAQAVQAGLLPNPLLHATVLRPREGGMNALDLGLSWDFLGLLTRSARQQAAEAELAAAQLDAAGKVLDLAGRVRAVWHERQAAQAALTWLRQEDEARQLAAEVTDRLHAAGNTTDLARLASRNAAQDSRLVLEEAEARLESAHARLAGLLGVPPDQPLGFPEGPDLPAQADSPLAVEQALARSLDLARLDADLAQARRLAGLAADTAGLEGLELGWNWDRESSGEWKDGPSLGLRLPIFDTGEARRVAARHRVNQLLAQRDALEREIRRQVADNQRQLSRARQRVERLRDDILPLRQQTLEAALVNYNAMQLGVLQLLALRQQQWLDQRRLTDALNAYWQVRVRHDLLALGRLPGTSPATPLASPVPAQAGPATGGH